MLPRRRAGNWHQAPASAHLLPQVALGQITGCVYLNCCSTCFTTAERMSGTGQANERLSRWACKSDAEAGADRRQLQPSKVKHYAVHCAWRQLWPDY